VPWPRLVPIRRKRFNTKDTKSTKDAKNSPKIDRCASSSRIPSADYRELRDAQAWRCAATAVTSPSGSGARTKGRRGNSVQDQRNRRSRSRAARATAVRRPEVE
jgi:hypothetical protein